MSRRFWILELYSSREVHKLYVWFSNVFDTIFILAPVTLTTVEGASPRSDA